MSETEEFIPDFYMLGGHACGRLALSYFLSWFGAVVNGECSLYSENARKNFIRCKTDRIYARGMTIDILGNKPISTDEKQPNTPIVWITRDPIDIMISFYNWNLADACFGKNNSLSLLESEFLPITIQHLPVLSLYDSFRKSVPSRAEPFVLDIEDINAENAMSSLRKIASYLDVPFNEKVSAVASIRFNTFANRIWALQPAKRFPYSVFSYLEPVFIIPPKLFDFHFNAWRGSQHIIDEFSYLGNDYLVFLPEKSYERCSSFLPEGFFDEKKRESCKRWLDVWMAHCEVTTRLYEERKMTPEKALEIMRSTPRFRSRFLRLMERETRVFGAKYPHLVEKWFHFHQLAA